MIENKSIFVMSVSPDIEEKKSVELANVSYSYMEDTLDKNGKDKPEVSILIYDGDTSVLDVKELDGFVFVKELEKEVLEPVQDVKLIVKT